MQWVDCFVLGRGEKILPAIIAAHATGNRHESPSVVWSDSFDIGNRYEIMQASEPYPYEVIMTNGKPFREGSIGCPNKCLFCGYTWQRKYIGDGTYSAGAQSMNSGNRERTIMDLLKLPPARWQDDGPLRIVGVDGTSERLRVAANKRITRDMFRAFLSGLAEIPKPHQVKLYFIVGYPGETDTDWHEFVDDIAAVDAGRKSDKQWSLLCHFTPFRAMPATPSAVWPMSYRNYRGFIAETLKLPGMKGNIFYQGPRFWAVEGMGTDSLSTVVHSAMCLRGTEDDADMMMSLARSRKYWSALGVDKIATLEKHIDVDRMFKAYTWEELPTRYLKTYTADQTMRKLATRKAPCLT
jgi:hypothetical protein